MILHEITKAFYLTVSELPAGVLAKLESGTEPTLEEKNILIAQFAKDICSVDPGISEGKLICLGNQLCVKYRCLIEYFPGPDRKPRGSGCDFLNVVLCREVSYITKQLLEAASTSSQKRNFADSCADMKAQVDQFMESYNE